MKQRFDTKMNRWKCEKIVCAFGRRDGSKRRLKLQVSKWHELKVANSVKRRQSCLDQFIFESKVSISAKIEMVAWYCSIIIALHCMVHENHQHYNLILHWPRTESFVEIAKRIRFISRWVFGLELCVIQYNWPGCVYCNFCQISWCSKTLPKIAFGCLLSVCKIHVRYSWKHTLFLVPCIHVIWRAFCPAFANVQWILSLWNDCVSNIHRKVH